MSSITRICTICNIEKDISKFKKAPRYTDGHIWQCKDCMNARQRNWRKINNKNKGNPDYFKKYYERNTEKIKQQSRDWRKNNKELAVKRDREYQIKNAQRVSEKAKQWRENNREYLKEYRFNTREKRKLIQNNRRARITGNGGEITEKEWKELCDFYNNTCLCCKRNDIKLTLDHVLPVKLGGKNVIENAQPLCQSCNSRKGARYIDYR